MLDTHPEKMLGNIPLENNNSPFITLQTSCFQFLQKKKRIYAKKIVKLLMKEFPDIIRSSIIISIAQSNENNNIEDEIQFEEYQKINKLRSLQDFLFTIFEMMLDNKLQVSSFGYPHLSDSDLLRFTFKKHHMNKTKFSEEDIIYLKKAKVKLREFVSSLVCAVLTFLPESLQFTNNLVHLKTKERNESQKPVNIYEKSHPETVKAMKYLSICYYQIKRQDLARPLLKECLDLRMTTLEISHPNIPSTTSYLDTIIAKTRRIFIFVFPEDILFHILDYCEKKDIGRLDNAMTNYMLQELWIELKKKFIRIFRNDWLRIFFCKQTLKGHSGEVTTITQLDPCRIATSSSDRTIRIWNTKTGDREQTLTGHDNKVFIVIRLDEGRIATGSSDNTIKIWNVANGLCQRTLFSVNLSTVIYLDDGRIASASADIVKIWNIESGLCVQTFRHTYLVNCLSRLSDGRLASGGQDSAVRIWNVETGACDMTLNGHSPYVLVLLQLSDGKIVAGACDKIKISNVTTGICEQTMPLQSIIVFLIDLNGGRIASAEAFLMVKIWNVTNGSCERIFNGHTNSILALIRLTDGRIASSSEDKTIKVWNTISGVCEQTLSGYKSSVRALVQLDDGNIVSGTGGGTIKIWSPVV